ncbi:arylesterase [Marinobacterium mangrovicola]|uniref:Acyl-CoA thioesterase-1 n=1 Tax=Marinobacterium mangrovicola TaxID=1476959 RepID=A0A4R1GGM0_9GAMM|nr:arylesterase [Marinobacterium mangrovicola]TCK06070.1 acyl-CoA thioesterase-1 [Marinobacterium mangrovicola]
MRTLLFLLLILTSPMSFASMLVLGDSLAAGYGIDEEEGWVNLMRQRLQSNGYTLEVVNASVSGETTSGGLSRLPALLETHQPSLVLIELGANDGLRGTPLNIVRGNLEQLVELSRASGAEVLMIGNRLPPNYGPQYTQAFFGLFAEVAGEKQIALVPFLLDGVASDWDLMQDDGYHPKANAQAKILDTVWTGLEPILDEARSE